MRSAIACALVLIALARVCAAPYDNPRRAGVVIVAAPGLRSEDLTRPELASLEEACRQGAAGWMNIRTGADSRLPGDEIASGYLTLGSGTRAIVPITRSDASHPPRATDDRQLRGLEALRRANDRLDHFVPIGALGEVCRSAGLRICVADSEASQAQYPHGLLLGMDSRGGVDRCETTDMSDPDAPYGARTDISRLKPDDGYLTIFVYSDIARAEQYGTVCTPEMARRHRRAALSRLNTLLDETLLPWAANRPARVAWLIAPPHSLSSTADRLVPVAVVGATISGGLLTSPTTRRRGLITAGDLVPTIAQYLTVRVPDHVVGRPAASDGSGTAPVSRWRALKVRWDQVTRSQAALGGLAGWRLVVLLGLLGALGLAHRSSERGITAWIGRPIGRSSRWIAAISGLASGALAVQAVSAFIAMADTRVGAAVLAASALLCAGVTWHRPSISTALALTAAFACMTCAVIGVTLYPPLVQDSWISYSVAEGARYYGIGNEMVGALAAACTVVAWPSMCRGRWTIPAAWYAALTVMLGLPSGGANFGGAAGAGLMAVGAIGAGCRNARQLAAVIGASVMAATIAVVVLKQVDTGPAATHLGMALAHPASAIEIAARKLALNVHLLLNSPWAFCFIAGLLVCTLAHRSTSEPNARRSWALLILGASGLLVFNDSGVVAAGMALSVGAPLLTAMRDRRPETSQPQRVADNAD